MGRDRKKSKKMVYNWGTPQTIWAKIIPYIWFIAGLYLLWKGKYIWALIFALVYFGAKRFLYGIGENADEKTEEALTELENIMKDKKNEK